MVILEYHVMPETDITVKIKLLHPDAKIPLKAHLGDAGLDLFAHSCKNARHTIEYSTGVAVEIPEGYVGLLFPRSSIYMTALRQSNCVGVIDSGYRGEIKIQYDVKDAARTMYIIGDKIGQLVIVPLPKVNLRIVDKLEDSERSDKGFGSSGN